MQRIGTVQAMENERTRRAGQVGFVPTMGYLHEGHLSLIRHARAENDVVVVSIFVNPTQFGPHDDLQRYPRDIEHDLRLLDAAGVDVVFTPTADEMYPHGFITYVEPTGPLVEQGEGAIRPGHFRGVATIVLMLFQLVQPHRAYFGQKDAQQVAVIQRMARDLHLPLTLHIEPTMRETDGLAMSSRNSYLDPVSRAAAAALYQALQAGRAAFEARPAARITAVRQALAASIGPEPLAHLDYADVRSAHSFLPLETFQAPALLLLAARIGNARLIDNFLLRADGTWDSGSQASELVHSQQ